MGLRLLIYKKRCGCASEGSWYWDPEALSVLLPVPQEPSLRTGFVSGKSVTAAESQGADQGSRGASPEIHVDSNSAKDFFNFEGQLGMSIGLKVERPGFQS